MQRRRSGGCAAKVNEAKGSSNKTLPVKEARKSTGAITTICWRQRLRAIVTVITADRGYGCKRLGSYSSAKHIATCCNVIEKNRQRFIHLDFNFLL